MAEKRENRRITQLYARSGWGWSKREWECLNALWSSESRFDHRAANPRSTAFGIAQVLKETDHRPRVQILRGLRYIEHRYDTPCKAWGFWLRNFYYWCYTVRAGEPLSFYQPPNRRNPQT
jgi:hypothetical protein